MLEPLDNRFEATDILRSGYRMSNGEQVRAYRRHKPDYGSAVHYMNDMEETFVSESSPVADSGILVGTDDSVRRMCVYRISETELVVINGLGAVIHFEIVLHDSELCSVHVPLH